MQIQRAQTARLSLPCPRQKLGDVCNACPFSDTIEGADTHGITVQIARLGKELSY